MNTDTYHLKELLFHSEVVKGNGQDCDSILEILFNIRIYRSLFLSLFEFLSLWKKSLQQTRLHYYDGILCVKVSQVVSPKLAEYRANIQVCISFRGVIVHRLFNIQSFLQILKCDTQLVQPERNI